MYDIVKVVKVNNGLQIVYLMDDRMEEDHFLYGNLIEMKVNALDLLEHPEDYWIDVKKHRIIPKK